MIILIILLAVLIIALGVSYVAYRMAFYSDRSREENIYAMSPGMTEEDFPKMKELVDRMVAREFEWVYITSHDGLRLAARYYHVADGAPVHIHCHGYRGTALRDFSGGNKMSHEMGHNALVIDERGCGQSEGNTISFGINERHDVRRWIDYVIERFGSDVKILLYGVSMGASTVLMVSGMDLPDNVKGITADCPFSQGEKIILKVCRDMKLPPKLMAPFVRAGARLFGKFNLNETTVVKEMKKRTVPVLLIHGESDSYVPYEMSREIYEANPEKVTFASFPDADHGLSYIRDSERYTKLIREFSQDCLK